MLMSSVERKAFIDRALCVGCGACIPVCPVHAIQMRSGWVSEIDTAKCIGCGRCAALCHRHAPQVLDDPVVET